MIIDYSFQIDPHPIGFFASNLGLDSFKTLRNLLDYKGNIVSGGLFLVQEDDAQKVRNYLLLSEDSLVFRVFSVSLRLLPLFLACKAGVDSLTACRVEAVESASDAHIFYYWQL